MENGTTKSPLIVHVNFGRALRAAAAPPAAARHLYVSPVGAAGKDNLADVVRRFGCERFDYLIFAFDDTVFDEEVFAPCRIVRRPGRRWEFVREFVTPELVANYGYLFLWPDDIRIHSFSWENFIAVMAANRLQMAQPALAYDSHASFRITLQRKKYQVGRFTDFVEIMVPVFAASAWPAFWQMVKRNPSRWGWGYDLLARSLCGYSNMGVIDCEPVEHYRPVQSFRTEAPRQMDDLLARHQNAALPRFVNYRPLRPACDLERETGNTV